MLNTLCGARTHKFSGFVLYKRSLSTIKYFQNGDHILLNLKTEASSPVFKKIKKNKNINTRWGSIAYDDLHGSEPRTILSTSKGREVRVNVPSLDEYCRYSPRLVTPVYPVDANLIVSLLDVHTDTRPSQGDEPKLCILEAGTGHGALTLHLARAIHGANVPIPPDALEELNAELHRKASPECDGQARSISSKAVILPDSNDSEDRESSSVSALSTFRESRRAVVHTVDVKAAHSHRARQVVREFRQGLYAGDVDFYVGDVGAWISMQLANRQAQLDRGTETPFLSHIILDAPDSPTLIAKASEALLTDGNLVLFCPSISQIMTAVKTVRAEKLPLVLDRVLETGPGLTGGREWDVRAVKPRALLRLEAARLRESRIEEPLGDDPSNTASSELGAEGEESAVEASENSIPEAEDAGWQMICRPKVGERLIGGGFLGIWKKMKQR